MIKSPIRSQMGTPRNAASTASCVIMSCVSGNSVVRSSPRYRMLIAKRATSAAFAGLDGGVGTGLSRGRRRLMPKREHVTCSEPTVTPINSAISSRRLPCSTRFLICSMRSGVNLTLDALFLHPVLRSATPVGHWRFHFFVASAPVRDLLLCAKYLFVAAIDGWVHRGLRRIGRSERDGGAGRVRSRCSSQGTSKAKRPTRETPRQKAMG